MKPFKELSREERMAELLEHANTILNRIHPGRGLTIEYIKMDDKKIKAFSDWDIEYHHIHTGLEYFVISENKAYPLYVVNITADSEMTAMDELFRLLGRKF